MVMTGMTHDGDDGRMTPRAPAFAITNGATDGTDGRANY